MGEEAPPAHNGRRRGSHGLEIKDAPSARLEIKEPSSKLEIKDPQAGQRSHALEIADPQPMVAAPAPAPAPVAVRPRTPSPPGSSRLGRWMSAEQPVTVVS